MKKTIQQLIVSEEQCLEACKRQDGKVLELEHQVQMLNQALINAKDDARHKRTNLEMVWAELMVAHGLASNEADAYEFMAREQNAEPPTEEQHEAEYRWQTEHKL